MEETRPIFIPISGVGLLTSTTSAPKLFLYLLEEAVRTIARSCLVGILAASLMSVPAFAANEKPLGMVTQAMDAQLGTAKAAVGTTVYPGDSLVTDEHARFA